MRETVKKEIGAKVALVLFLIFTTWWIFLRLTNQPHNSNANQLFAAVYGITALWGGIWGVIIARKWGWLHSVMGKSILFFSIGLFFQEVGQILYSYYIYFKKIENPYPSLGDFFFYSTIPLYIIAVIYLAKASGVHISLRSFQNKLQAVLIPAGMLVFSYVIFLQQYAFDWSQPVKTLLDLGVPFGQAVYISLAILTYTLTRGILGGIMRSKVLFILFALLFQYIADWTFLYQASRSTWYAGELNDYQYFCAYFLMTLALIGLRTALRELKET